MSTARLAAPTVRAGRGVARGVAGNRPSHRIVSRPIHIASPRRPPESPHGPSHIEVVRRWEELEWWACTYCDRSFGAKVVPEIDHIRPLSKGGLHEWSNLAPSCRDCNRAKSDTDMTDWLAVTAGQADTQS